MDFQIQKYETWLKGNVYISDAYTADSLKKLTKHLLCGGNYRAITEFNTKCKIALTDLWLSDVVEVARKEYGLAWKEKMLAALLDKKKKTTEEKYLQYWLLGLTQKTFNNIDGNTKELPSLLSELEEQLTDTLTSIKREKELDNVWIMMMCGSAALTIRGSDKSKNGKWVERVLLKSMLTLLGFTENKNFWVDLQRDNEVERETDAEVETKRGRIRIELGLIASGNQEVIEDKINRVGPKGVVIFDIVGAKTNIYDTAEKHNVKLIQIRHTMPLTQLYDHLKPLCNFELNEPPTTEKSISKAIDSLDDEVFSEVMHIDTPGL
ncbi:CfrBI restriction endonuclease [Thermoplasmatales archaeon BRNA1]|nr:CfrBI restriction endonuclease [Thermoplasmatales archaeon BRNA1]